ncbi:heterokaryon incompatibility protein-domain-containing protein [Immersiella caudata]|uniref:Heterokaryon incompatibility protein-domain-containing protein n=1 Tax=Immersiella caudata TaxID=314043 RepID=A0AA39U4N0_9PEZI|nr:heterokaryon incompatibility protein-domain-containing protein [Immersiella caudata]
MQRQDGGIRNFDFLWREPGAGPTGPPARHVELPFYSRSNDVFFASSSFAVKVTGPDFDHNDLPTAPSLAGTPSRDGLTEQPLRPFICECRPWCTRDLYPSLPSGNAIRILEVMPGTHESPLICNLHIATLPQAVNSYSALSYAWQVGFEPTPLRTIICNDREVQIGENLFDALQRIRHVTSSRMIWADALCINQEDVEERSMQVAKMGDIFHGAYEVLVWLGLEGTPSWQAFSAKAALSDLCTIINKWRENSGKGSRIQRAEFYRRSADGDVQAVTECAPDERSKRFGYNKYWWAETLELFHRRWFHRVWVIQEVALARSARVLLGEYEISWEVIGLAASILRTNFNTLVPTITHRHTRKTLSAFRTGGLNAYFMYRLSRSQSHKERMNPDFHQLLILTRSFDCQDDRDRIYGLIGLPFSRSSGVDGSPFIVPDYSKPAAEVYLEVVTKLIQESSSLRFLSSVQRPSFRLNPEEHGKFNPDIPSWVPQMGLLRNPVPVPVPNHRSPTSPHGNLPAQVPHETAHAKDFAKLLLDGGLHWTFEGGIFDTPDEQSEEGWVVKHAYRKTLTEGQMELLLEKLGSFAQGGNGTRFLDAAGMAGKGRCRYETNSGWKGIGPGAMEPGDDICVMRGARAPFVLRAGEQGTAGGVGEGV